MAHRVVGDFPDAASWGESMCAVVVASEGDRVRDFELLRDSRTEGDLRCVGTGNKSAIGMSRT